MNIDTDDWSLNNTADRLYFMFVTTLFHRRHLFVLIYESKSTQTDDVCELELWQIELGKSIRIDSFRRIEWVIFDSVQFDYTIHISDIAMFDNWQPIL